MWAYVLRKLLYNIPVYLGIILIVMAALRVNDPVYGFLGKRPTLEQYLAFQKKAGLDKPFLPVSITFPPADPSAATAADPAQPAAAAASDAAAGPGLEVRRAWWRVWAWDVDLHNPADTQYVAFLWDVVRLDFDRESWERPTQTVGQRLASAVGPTVAITVPGFVLTTIITICIGLLAVATRGGPIDRAVMFLAVLGMSVSYLVYIIFGQYWGAYLLGRGQVFAISGYEPGIANWAHYCLLPVLIGVVVALGYDARFYRAVMVEEIGKDYITTARAKGAPGSRVLFVHLLKNAMIPIITRVMITLPFLLEGSILVERYFNIPGMGNVLIGAINAKDFPVIEAFAAVFAAIFVVSNILTDVMYALVDPRVRLR